MKVDNYEMIMLLGLDFTKFPLMYIRILLFLLMPTSLTKTLKPDVLVNKHVPNYQFKQFLAFLVKICEDKEVKMTKAHILMSKQYDP